MNTPSLRHPRWLRHALVTFLLIAFGAWLPVQRAYSSADHDHSHHHAAAGLSLNDGQRWASDQPLRNGMQRIRDVFEQAGIARADDRFTTVDAQAFSASVQENVNYLIANCQLSPKADATLHVFITQLMTGAAHVAGDAAAAEGWELMAQALQHYPVYFEHPGWVAINPPQP